MESSAKIRDFNPFCPFKTPEQYQLFQAIQAAAFNNCGDLGQSGAVAFQKELARLILAYDQGTHDRLAEYGRIALEQVMMQPAPVVFDGATGKRYEQREVPGPATE